MLHPVLTSSRLLSDLSGVWNFKLDYGEDFKKEWFQKPLEDFMTMPIPIAYNDLKEGIDFRDHYRWVSYQRTFSVPEFVKAQRVMLRFDAVAHGAKVYISGDLFYVHEGEFLPFEAKITDLAGKEEYLLAVTVNSIIDYTTLPVGGENNVLSGGSPGFETKEPQKLVNNPNFGLFNYCSITRPVKIYATLKSYISDITVTAEINGANAALGYEINTIGTGECLARVFDREGNKVTEAAGCEGMLKIEQVKLWQPLNTYLYNICVTFSEDVCIPPYGARTVRVDGTKLPINEKPSYLKGYGKHEDTFPNGRGINLLMDIKDISLVKWQGANSFRTSYYPYSEKMMRLCDQEGTVVTNKTTAVGASLEFGGGVNSNGQRISTFDKEHGVQTQEHHKEIIRDLIARDKNYTCVVTWSVANEPNSYPEGAYEYFAPLYELARSLGPQKRPCTLVSVQTSGGPATDVSAKLSDMIYLDHCYGWYFGAPDLQGPKLTLREESDQWAECSPPVIFTEYGAGIVMELHDATPVTYAEEYQVDRYKVNHKVFDDYDFVMGEQAWNSAGLVTSQEPLRVQGGKKGLLTRDRRPKPAAHYSKERWHQIPDLEYEK